MYDQSKISWFKWLHLRSIMIVKYFFCILPLFYMNYDDIRCSSGHCGRNLSLINHILLLIALQIIATSFTNPFWIDDFVEPLMIHDAWPVTIPTLIMESLIRQYAYIRFLGWGELTMDMSQRRIWGMRLAGFVYFCVTFLW